MTTLKRYLTLLENIFLTVSLPAWFASKDKRVIKTPKLYFNDVGLLCSLLGVERNVLLEQRVLAGVVFENFVVMELMKQATWSDCMPTLYHFRNHAGFEVDIVLEAANQQLVGLEVKLTSQVKAEDFKGLQKLQEITGKHFHRGIMLYTGDSVIQFRDQLVAIPISALWEY